MVILEHQIQQLIGNMYSNSLKSENLKFLWIWAKSTLQKLVFTDQGLGEIT